MGYLTFLKIIHLTGLIAGFGRALDTDYLIVTRGIFQPLQKEMLREISACRILPVTASCCFGSRAQR